MVKIIHNGDDDDDGGGDIEDHVGQVLVKLRAEAGAFLVRVSNCLLKWVGEPEGDAGDAGGAGVDSGVAMVFVSIIWAVHICYQSILGIRLVSIWPNLLFSRF